MSDKWTRHSGPFALTGIYPGLYLLFILSTREEQGAGQTGGTSLPAASAAFIHLPQTTAPSAGPGSPSRSPVTFLMAPLEPGDLSLSLPRLSPSSGWPLLGPCGDCAREDLLLSPLLSLWWMWAMNQCGSWPGEPTQRGSLWGRRYPRLHRDGDGPQGCVCVCVRYREGRLRR